jgi:hypothetical protein
MVKKVGAIYLKPAFYLFLKVHIQKGISCVLGIKLILILQCLHILYLRALPLHGLNKFKNLRGTLAKNAKVIFISLLFIFLVDDLLSFEVFTLFIFTDCYLVRLAKAFPPVTNKIRLLICLGTLSPYGYTMLPSKKKPE